MREYLNYIDFVTKAIEPLHKILPVKKLSYMEICHTGEYLFLNSNGQVFEKCLETSFYPNCVTDVIKVYGDSEYYIDDIYSKRNYDHIQQSYKDYFAKFDYGHALFMVKQGFKDNRLIYRFFIYESAIENDAINHEYTNHLSVLNSFNEHFTKKLSDIQSNLPYTQLEEHRLEELQRVFANHHTLAKRNAEKLQMISSFNPIFSSDKTVKLTPRESEVLMWYMQGKTAVETGIILGISFRTVQNIFERMKTKLDCNSKYELIKKASHLVNPAA